MKIFVEEFFKLQLQAQGKIGTTKLIKFLNSLLRSLSREPLTKNEKLEIIKYWKLKQDQK